MKKQLVTSCVFLWLGLFGLAGCTSNSGARDAGSDASGPDASDDGGGAASDALWRIIAQCVNVDGEQTCQCPALLSTCCGDTNASYTDGVWAETPDFVVIRDMKQCGCSADFVHGLAIPRSKITGVEDPNRPDGIWPFAWENAASRIANPQEICLAINPPQARSQNQMHVHVMRLFPQTRTWFDDAAAQAQAARQYGLVFMDLADINAVFTAVLAQVGQDQIGNSGILVVQSKDGKYQALLTNKTVAANFCQTSCD